MGLLDMLVQSGNGNLLSQVQNMTNLDDAKTKNLLNAIGGSLLGETKNKIKSKDDTSVLEDWIFKDKSNNRFNNPNLTDENHKKEGKGLLELITGSKDRSRNIASNISNASGVDFSMIKKLLPIVAPMIIGTLSQSQQTNTNHKSSQNSSLLSILDFDNDGQIIDDIMGIAKKFF